MGTALARRPARPNEIGILASIRRMLSLSRLRERVGVRGIPSAQTRGDAPSPARLRSLRELRRATSPRKRGEVKIADISG